MAPCNGADSILWCEVESILNSIYECHHASASQQQLKSDISILCDFFHRFTQQAFQQEGCPLWADLSVADTQVLRTASSILQSDQVSWFPDYGCALLALGPPLPAENSTLTDDERPRPGDLDIHLVGLDGWRFKVHSTPQCVQHTAVCSGHTALFCGSLAADELKGLVGKVHSLLAEMLARRHKDKEHGFQRTPALVHAKVCEVLAAGAAGSSATSEVSKKLARGGFTDVGLHTGADTTCDTCWPLVKSVVKVLLEHDSACCNSSETQPASLLFRQAMAHLDLWVLSRQLPLIKPSTATPTMLTTTMQMLRAATVKAAELADDGYDMSAFEAACSDAVRHLQAVAAERAGQVAQALELPPVESPELFGSAIAPQGILPEPLVPGAEDAGLDAARQRAERNLGSLNVVPTGASITTLCAAMSQPQWAQPSSDVAAQLALCSVENELFGRANQGFDAPTNQLSVEEVADLEAVVDAYRAAVQRFLQSPAASAVMRVEQLSREVLVVWVAYCLTHQAACREHPIVLRYGVLGPYHDLRHLVLSDREAVDAALSVSAYLQIRAVPGRWLFSLRDGGEATMAMAHEFATACPQLQQVWAMEQQDAADREQRHWDEVRRKQQLARQLRVELGNLKAKGESLKSKLGLYKRRLDEAKYTHGEYSGEYKAAQQQYNSAQSDVSFNVSRQQNVERQLKEAEAAPPPVIQPLPSGSKKALQWLFFLHMPPLFRHLSRASFLAQQMLLPRPCDASVAKAIAATFITSLVQHYNNERHNHTYTAWPRQEMDGSDGAVQIWSRLSAPQPSSIGPKHVDSFFSPSDGVWHPDTLLPCMAWSGSGSVADSGQGFPTFFNPFAALAPEMVKAIELYFTERLPEDANSLQWAVHVCRTAAETRADRGNWAMARQDTRPSWLSKPAFLDFGRLRAYPLLQLRQLCAVLHDRTLPLDHPAVHTLLQQLLFHMGSLTDDSPPRLLWRVGWEQEADVLPTLCHELSALAEELEQTPRAHDTVMLLGGMAAYLSDWYEPCGAVARRFAAMTSRVADDLDEQLAAASSNSGTVAELLAKQCRARIMALLCYAAGPVDNAEDVGSMLQLMVLIHQGRVFQQNDQLRAQLERLHVRALGIMARRAGVLICLAKAHPEVLTVAVARVLQQRAPRTLNWQRLPNTASFEAVGGTHGGLYSINLLDGTVLYDGWPPSRLPKEVTSHPLYRRTFGEWDFEIVPSGTGVMRTLRSVRGRLYDFCVSANGQQLSITEVDPEQGVQLELLDVGGDGACGQWGRQLPVCLRQLYSHWLCRDRAVMVLRPHNFQQHDVFYVITCSPTEINPEQMYDCRRVPIHLQSKHWVSLLSDCWLELADHMMLLRNSRLTNTIFCKFEDASYIHVYDVSNGGSSTEELLFELPRYRLEFKLQRDGQLVSQDYSGYRLRQCQQLVAQQRQGSAMQLQYTLPEFTQYLVLERMPDGSVVLGARRADELVLVPAGEVVRSVEQPALGAAAVWHCGSVCVAVDDDCGAHVKTHCYEVHGRFGHLRASSVPARLQLAALYAATGTLLPEPLCQCTGGQIAMDLLRQCWGNVPLPPEELAQLRNVGRLGGYLTPGLRLLAHDLEASAAQLRHLHVAAKGSAAVAAGLAQACRLDADAAICYTQERDAVLEPGGWRTNARQLLTPGEEVRTLGVRRAAVPRPAWRRQQHYWEIKLKRPLRATPSSFVEEKEAELRGFVHAVAAADSGHGKARPAYPLLELQEGLRASTAATAATAAAAGATTPLERDMHRELEKSWHAYHATPTTERLTVAPDVLQHVLAMKVEVTQRRAAAEEWLIRSLATVPDGVGCHGNSFRLLSASGLIPTPGLLDLVRAAWQRHLLQNFNPFLSPDAERQLHEGIIEWLKLCVLEDRLGRLEKLAAAGEKYRVALIQELLVSRTWDASAHPQWLVFEVEGQLQIRPAQHSVAQHLLSDPGAIAQLNMGEGKTRVILPMLALQCADGSRVVRLNFLSTLLDEAYGHLHQHLCASVLGRKLFLMPFHRDVNVTAADARAMRACLAYCMKEGGLLLVAPEHRMSMHLKWHELGVQGEERAADCTALDDVAQLPYMDILDESDELLHHRFQLIYACGSPTALPSVKERTGAAEALFRLMSRLAACATAPLLPSAAAVLEPPPGSSPGAFCGLRLLPGEALAVAVPGFHLRLAKELVADPPYELKWLKRHALRERIIQCITTEAQAAEDILGPDAVGPAEHQLSDDQLAVVLALRGLLACNLLQHCLQKRHLVDYGVARHVAARKRMAVPFRAAHTPSERSEFAQPDVAHLLTNLSYYYDGLSQPEFEAALRTLLCMGANAQQDIYREWLQLSADGIDAEDMPTVTKVDTSNAQQMELMFRYFSHNMAVVDFWLNHCVFPSETRQFPQRLAASAWHLAENARRQVVGFSGTNDNHRLLPLQVHQAQVAEASLRATNGKMLAVILDHTLGYTTLPQEAAPEGGSKPVWQVLLDTVLRLGLDALLDCGALLAGASNREAANYLIPRLDRARFQGVCYFDEALRCWVISDARGRRMPRHSSPIAERDTFVIFDDARCRGADLQLRRDAVGLLTLGPGVCKDKVMQAAGRLRQLGRGQKLHFAATVDVSAKVLQLGGLTLQRSSQTQEPQLLQVLRWVMCNTVQATLRGVTQWAAQGLHFAATHGAPDRALLDERLELEVLYGGSKAERPMGQVVADRAAEQRKRCAGMGGDLAETMADVMSDIVARGTLYGEGHMVVANGGADGDADEECERELEEEEEEEREQERDMPQAQAACETDWLYRTAVTATSPGQLDSQARLLPLKDVAKRLEPNSLHRLKWSSKVWCTANFLNATAAVPAGAFLTEYLRPVDALLLFPTGDVLLLSEREADQLLALLLAKSSNRSTAPAAVLVSLCYARLSLTNPTLSTMLLATSFGMAAGPPDAALAASALVSVQLFNGEASYGSQAQRAALRAVVRRRRRDVEALVGMRGKLALLPRSDLEKACEDVEA